MIKRHGTLLIFFVLLAAGVLFVWGTSGALPDLVASAFNVEGAASETVPHWTYVGRTIANLLLFPTLLVVLLRLLQIITPKMLRRLRPDAPTLPGRRAAAVAGLVWRADLLASAIVLFMCYEHGFVLYASTQVPPSVPATLYDGSLLMALALVAVWAVLFMRHSRSMKKIV